MAYLQSAFRITGLAALAAASLTACAVAPSVPSLRVAQAETAHDRDPGDASVYGLYLAGEAAIDRGSSGDAAFYFAKASALDPSAETIRDRAFTSALVTGDVGSAARIAAEIPEGPDPIQGLARLTRAVDALADGHGKIAETLLSGAPVATAHANAAALLKPWAAATAGDWSAAEALPVITGNPVLSTVASLGKAELLEREGKLIEAEQAFNAHATGKNGLFIVGYGAFLERRGRYADASALYAKALIANPNDLAFARAKARIAQKKSPPPPSPTLKEGAAEALIAPAVFMIAQHQGDSGLGYLRLALHLDPSLDEAWVLVGEAMTNAGDANSAREAYEHVKPGSDQYSAARGNLALALQKSGDKTGALALTQEALQAAPGDSRLLTLYADLLSDDSRYDEAAATLNKAIEATGEANAGWTLFYLRGASEERAGRWPAAEADLKRSLKLKPDEPEVMNYLGYAWVDRGEHLPEAVAMLEKAEALQPDSGAIVDSLGWARYRTHDYASAIIDLERAIQLDPSDPEVNDHLGDVYWRVGRRLEAQYQWRRVLSLKPDDKMRAAVEMKLKNGLPPLQTASTGPAATGLTRP